MLLLAPRLCAGSCSMAKLERPLVCSECADSVLPRPVGVAAMPRPLVRSRTSVELRQPERRSNVLELRRPPRPRARAHGRAHAEAAAAAAVHHGRVVAGPAI